MRILVQFMNAHSGDKINSITYEKWKMQRRCDTSENNIMQYANAARKTTDGEFPVVNNNTAFAVFMYGNINYNYRYRDRKKKWTSFCVPPIYIRYTVNIPNYYDTIILYIYIKLVNLGLKVWIYKRSQTINKICFYYN